MDLSAPLLLLAIFCVQFLCSFSEEKMLIPGTMNLGGIYQVRNFTSYAKCGPMVSTTNVILTEAHRFSVEFVNKHVFRGKNFTMGTVVIDSCSTDVIGLQRCAEFVEHKNTGFCFKDSFKVSNASGTRNVYISNGFMTSGVARNMNYLLQAFCMPLICSGCSSSEFDNPNLFRFLLRTYPSDRFQARALERLLNRMRWTHITVLYEDSTYGVNLLAQLIYAIRKEKSDICIENSEPLSQESEPDWMRIKATFDYSARKLLPRVVLVLSNYIMAYQVFDRMVGWNLSGKVQIVGSDGWSTRDMPSRFKPLLNNAIATDVSVNEFLEFDRHLANVTLKEAETVGPGNASANQWLAALISTQHNCTTDRGLRGTSQCNGSERLLPKDYSAASRKARLVFRTVYVPAVALATILRESCADDRLPCENFTRSLTGELIYEKMQATNYSIAEDSFSFFNDSNSADPNYNMFIFNATETVWSVIGSFNVSKVGDVSFTFNEPIGASKPSLWDTIEDNRKKCFPDCGYRGYRQRSATECCWTCKKCTRFEIVLHGHNQDTCHKCPPRFAPDPYTNYSNCTEILEDKALLAPTNSMIFLLGANGIASVVDIASGILILINVKTPFVRGATGGLVVLICFALCGFHWSTILSLPSSSSSICASSWAIGGLLLALCHGIAFVKVLRMVRPKYLIRNQFARYLCRRSVNSTLWIVSCCLLQVIVLLCWLLLKHPHINVKELPNATNYYYSCSANADGNTLFVFLLPFLYLLSSLYLSVRGLSSPFAYQVWQNRFLVSGNVCLVSNYLIFVPLFVLHPIDGSYNKAVLLMSIILVTAFVFWLTLVFPVVFLLIFRSGQNTDAFVMAKHIKTITRSHRSVLWVMEPVAGIR